MEQVAGPITQNPTAMKIILRDVLVLFLIVSSAHIIITW